MRTPAEVEADYYAASTHHWERPFPKPPDRNETQDESHNGKRRPGRADKTLTRPVQGSRSYEVMPTGADRSKQRQLR